MPEGEAPAPWVVWTIGHSTRPLSDLVERLRREGVTRLVDIRTIPRSRHNPQYDRSTLPTALAALGIVYEHAPGLGGLRKPDPASRNLGWRNASFRGFADYMQTPPFARALDALVARARASPTAVLCAEAVPWRCHRSLVADALTARGGRVRHLIGDGPAEEHRLTPFARVDGSTVTYPSAPAVAHPLESFDAVPAARGRARRVPAVPAERPGPAVPNADPGAPAGRLDARGGAGTAATARDRRRRGGGVTAK